MVAFIEWESGYPLIGALKAEMMISKKLRELPEFHAYPAASLLPAISKAKSIYDLVDTFAPLFDEDVIFDNLWIVSWLLYPIREILGKKTPIIQIPHGGHMDKFTLSDMVLSYPFTSKNDRLIIGSNSLKNSLEMRFPKMNPVFLPTYGVDLTVQKPLSQQQTQKILNKYGITPETKYIAYIGTLHPADLSLKFWSYLLDYFEEKGKKYDVRLLQIGGAHTKVKQVMDKYANVITTGRVSESDLTALINSALFTIHLSARTSDTMGLALLESLACGKPVLCTGWNGFEFIKDYYNGCRVKLSIEETSNGRMNLKFIENAFEEQLEFLLENSTSLKNECLETASNYDINYTVSEIRKMCAKLSWTENLVEKALDKPLRQFFPSDIAEHARIPADSTLEVINRTLATTKIKGYYRKVPRKPVVYIDIAEMVVPHSYFAPDYVLS